MKGLRNLKKLNYEINMYKYIVLLNEYVIMY